MLRPRRPRGQQMQTAMPSQAPSSLTPFMPGAQPDMYGMSALQAPHEHGYGGPPPVYVISTYDARPINAVDFNTYTGANKGGAANPDIGFDGQGGPYFTSSTFYLVQPGRVAVLREWQLLLVPNEGEPIPEGGPVIAANGTSNFRVTISFLVDGTFQEGMSGLTTWNTAFGDLFGECYILAQPGQTIEMRVTGGTQIFPTGSNWLQALMSMHGNLLLSRGQQVEFEPGTDATLPTHEMTPEAAIK